MALHVLPPPATFESGRMSRPVYEPNPARTDSVLGFGSDQLFRRPAPVISAGITSAAYMEFDLKTIVTATTTNLTGGTAGQEKVKGTAMTVDNTTGRVTFVEDGIYAAWLNTEWTTAFAFLKMARVTWVVTGDQLLDATQDIIGEAETGAGVDRVATSSVRFVQVTGGNNFLIASVRQESGVNKVVSADLTVVQLAAIAFP